MNSLVYSTIESVAYQNHFERSEGSQEIALFASSRHCHQVAVADDGTTLFFHCAVDAARLRKMFPTYAFGNSLQLPHPVNDLTDHLHLLGQFFQAAASLPEEAGVPATDAIVQAKERLGQDIYRTHLLMAWNNACAVTGLQEPRLLRASHAKPWKDASDEERLDPANGFPLAVHLDLLFDQGLISFADDGAILLSRELTPQARQILNITPDMHLRTALSPRQRQYLAYHRQNVFLEHLLG